MKRKRAHSAEGGSLYEPVGRYLSLIEAETTCAMLEANGLRRIVRDEFVAGLNWFYGPALGGIAVEVPSEHAGEARLLLDGEVAAVEEGVPGDRDYFEAAAFRRKMIGAASLLLWALAELGLILFLLIFWTMWLLRRRRE